MVYLTEKKVTNSHVYTCNKCLFHYKPQTKTNHGRWGENPAKQTLFLEKHHSLNKIARFYFHNAIKIIKCPLAEQ
jgi:hypothetical protein